jgi:DNA-binding transcriptional LysR family regulator
MSKVLQRLRDQIGDPILVRSGHSMFLTPRAASLVEPVTAALAAAGRVLAPPASFDPLAARGTFSVAMPEHVHTTVAVPLVERIQARAPGLDLRIRLLGLATRAEVVRGEVQLVVVPDLSALPHLPKPDLSEFVLRPLYREKYAVVSRRRSRKKRWTLEGYAAARHLLVATLGESDVGVVDVVLARKGLKRRVAVTVPSFLQAAHLLERTDLVATLPDRFAATAGHALDIQKPPLALPDLPMLLGWHARDTQDPRHRWMREEIAACVA